MSTTPVFDRVFAQFGGFRALPQEYTDRFTPEVARQQGQLHGERTERERILSIIAGMKPTKALDALRAEIEGTEDE